METNATNETIDVDMENEENNLEILGTPTSKTTGTATAAGTSSFVDCESIIGTTRAGDEIGDVGSSKKQKSNVWKYFNDPCMVDDTLKCKCKRCGNWYSCKPSNGTTHLGRHIKSCFKVPKFQNVSGMFDNRAAFLTKWKFDPKMYREKLARAIIKHDLPFSYAEYDGINEVNRCLNPEFKSITRNTAKDDCMKVYNIEKENLKKLLAAHSGRICLTSDVWTAVTTTGYMSVTAHFIDEKWELNSKLLSFVELDTAHSGFELSGKLIEVLKDWGIESKIFSLTLDNASSNDSMVRILKERLNLQDSLLCGGEFFHVRCSAHILNLIVQEGLKVVDDALIKIRNSVKYVRTTDGRLRDFQKCVEEVHLTDIEQEGGFVKLDMPIRWNSTYSMLESALRYRRAFTSLSYNDTHYKYCPTNEEWERGGRICEFLEPFFTITNLISGSSYPTSNLYFLQIAQIEMKLNELVDSDDEVIRDMAKRMKVKFDKYWNEYCATLAFGSILDPNSKLKFLTFCYKILDPNGYEAKVKKVKDSLYKLFHEYDNVDNASSSCHTIFSSNTPSQSQPRAANKVSIMDRFNQELNEEESTNGHSELDLYLDERFKPFPKVSALDYWKVNANRYPRLAKMARDILSIPITTVASESTFSIGGRILTKYRNCLLPNTVQALICTRNWLHGFKEVKSSDTQEEVEEVGLSKEDSSNVGS